LHTNKEGLSIWFGGVYGLEGRGRDEDEPLDNVRSALCASIDHAGYQRVSASVFGTFIAILLAGCSTSGSLLVDPGHYSVYHCDAMPGQLAGIQQRQHDLSNLMARASEGGGGTLIGTMAYRTDYQSAIDEEKVLRRVAAGKNCNLPPPAPTAPIPPAAPAMAAHLHMPLPQFTCALGCSGRPVFPSAGMLAGPGRGRTYAVPSIPHQSEHIALTS
jgi:hypothetical protein